MYPPNPLKLALDVPRFRRIVRDAGADVILSSRDYFYAIVLPTWVWGALRWPPARWYTTDHFRVSGGAAGGWAGVWAGKEWEGTHSGRRMAGGVGGWRGVEHVSRHSCSSTVAALNASDVAASAAGLAVQSSTGCTEAERCAAR